MKGAENEGQGGDATESKGSCSKWAVGVFVLGCHTAMLLSHNNSVPDAFGRGGPHAMKGTTTSIAVTPIFSMMTIRVA